MRSTPLSEKIRSAVSRSKTNPAVTGIATTLQAEKDNLITILSELFKHHHAIGFATFYEQHNGMHINQTFTGITIGAKAHVS